MGQLWRNGELRRWLWLQVGLTSTAVVGSGLIWSPAVAAYVLLVCVLFMATAVWVTRQRYNAIADLSLQLNQVMHGDLSSRFLPHQEGELAILSSEIHKAVIRLQEQSAQLSQEKQYLKDSIEDISHQLKTPLTSIHLILPRLRREEATAVETTAAIRELNSLLHSMEWLITALLKMAQLDSGTTRLQKEPVSVAALLQRAVAPMVIPMEVKGVRWQQQIPATAVVVGDLLWSVEAVSNIIKNCVEHTPAGGQIRVEAAENPIYTEITISDTGPGFAPEALPHLFKRFYKANQSTPNHVGIGLALARKIISAQNGTIKAENGKHAGAKFTIRFYKAWADAT